MAYGLFLSGDICVVDTVQHDTNTIHENPKNICDRNADE